MEYYKLKIKSLSYELRKLQETNTNNESEILSLTLKLENVQKIQMIFSLF